MDPNGSTPRRRPDGECLREQPVCLRVAAHRKEVYGTDGADDDRPGVVAGFRQKAFGTSLRSSHGARCQRGPRSRLFLASGNIAPGKREANARPQLRDVRSPIILAFIQSDRLP